MNKLFLILLLGIYASNALSQSNASVSEDEYVGITGWNYMLEYSSGGGATSGGSLGKIAEISVNGEQAIGHILENSKYENLIEEVLDQGVQVSDITVTWEFVNAKGLYGVWNPSAQYLKAPFNNLTGIMFPGETLSNYPSMLKFDNEQGHSEFYLPESSVSSKYSDFVKVYFKNN